MRLYKNNKKTWALVIFFNEKRPVFKRFSYFQVIWP